jgi:uncharacterized membrane protein
MPGIKMRAPDGRRWTLKEMIQGKPLGAPSHSMLIHFPVAFYVAALAFDIMSRVGDFGDSAPLAATWLIIGAFGFTVLAVITGAIDYFSMVPGSTKRRWATRHALFQVTAFAFFVVNLAVRFGDRELTDAKTLWIVLDAVGVAFMLVGQWLGGVLVYEMGMRVSTVERAEARMQGDT